MMFEFRGSRVHEICTSVMKNSTQNLNKGLRRVQIPPKQLDLLYGCPLNHKEKCRHEIRPQRKHSSVSIFPQYSEVLIRGGGTGGAIVPPIFLELGKIAPSIVLG